MTFVLMGLGSMLLSSLVLQRISYRRVYVSKNDQADLNQIKIR